MLRQVSLIFFCCFLFPAVMAQEDKMHRVVADFFYGFPEGYVFLIEDEENRDIKSFGPVGGKIEVRVKQRVGIGASYSFTRSLYEFTEPGWDNLPENYFHTSVNYERYRIMLNWNFYLINHPNYHLYFGSAIGYANHKERLESTNPGYQSRVIYSYRGNIAFRPVQLGLRWFPVKPVGLFSEIGIGGGGLILFGLSLKI